MDPVVALIVFAVIFPAELPDKTALASLILGTRYKASLVFAGVAAAFTVHVILAVAAGSLIRLLPRHIVEGIVAAMFLIGAVLLLREGDEAEADVDEVPAESPDGLSSRKVIATSFLVILVAEFGDLTQIVTANLAAKYHDPLAVGLGATLALWAVGGIAIVGGQQLLTRVPLKRVTQVAALIMVVLSVLSLVQALGG